MRPMSISYCQYIGLYTVTLHGLGRVKLHWHTQFFFFFAITCYQYILNITVHAALEEPTLKETALEAHSLLSNNSAWIMYVVCIELV